MKTFIIFLKKEILEQIRTKKLMILGLLFIFFGILNPLTAKMTPWLLEVLSESMESSGINITIVEITALDSWVQFFKNIPMLLIIFILMQLLVLCIKIVYNCFFCKSDIFKKC